MRTNLLIIAVALLGALLGLAVSTGMDSFFAPSVPANVTVLKPGDARADLALADLDGGKRRLAEWDGKLVLVNFWASWCGPCREEMPLLDAKRTELATRGFEVVGIAIDEVDSVRDFLKDRPVQYPILLADADEDASIRYGDTRGVLPYSVLIGRDGRILAQRAGNFTQGSLERWIAPYL
jgi:thiol-disulfide isomerase/thioredoxin